MNYKGIICEVMLKGMGEEGFSFSTLGKNTLCFQNEDRTRQVLIDTERYGLHKLRFAYQVTGKHIFRFYLNYLDPSFCPVAKQTYETKEELAFYLESVMRDTTQIILPYLDVMDNNYVEYDESLSSKMSINLWERISRFRRVWDFSMRYEPAQLKKLDTIMDSMRSAISFRKEDFYRHLEELLDLSACYGELLNSESHTPRNWAKKESSPGHFEYVVGPTQYNPLWRVMYAWNFGPEIAQYSLQGYHLKVEA